MMATKMIFPRLFIALAIVLGVFIPASIVMATPPARTQYLWIPLNTLTDVCEFDVTVISNVDVEETDFFDKDGNLTMVQLHTTEQDTFSANGKSLVGIPFKPYVKLLFDSDGNMTHIYGAGLMEKIILPDGSLFISAGRVDFVGKTGTYVLSPDKGNSGNIDAFCAALAP